MTVTCKKCGSDMLAEHGIIHYSDQTGVTWWKCSNSDCGRRVKQEYEIREAIVTSQITELVEPW